MTSGPKINWAALVRRGIESDELDYKAAQNWRELDRRGKAKFARHCTALANTKGGYIVVGVGEDKAGKPSLYTGMTDEQLKSFDPTDVGNFINRRVEPPIDFEIVRPKVGRKQYVIFVVRRFKELPHVCSNPVDEELQQGCFYIRTQDASSRIAYRSSEIHDLVQRALRNQREILGRMIRGLLYEKGVGREPLAESQFKEELRNARTFISRNARAALADPIFEFIGMPESYVKKAFGLSEVQTAAEDALFSFYGEPLIVLDAGDESYFTNVSLRSLSLSRKSYFQAFRSGLFHYMGGLPKKKDVTTDFLVHYICGSVFFLANYYNSLGYEDEVVSVALRLSGMDGRRLQFEASGAPKAHKPYVCHIPEIHVELKRSVADLSAGIVEHAFRAFRNVLYCFNVPDGRHIEIRRRISEYFERRG